MICNILITVLISFFGCKTDINSIYQIPKDTIKSGSVPLIHDSIKESFLQEDILGNEYLITRLKPIRNNFKRINTINKWSSVISKNLLESIEGGEAKFYYSGGELEKIITRHFGETFQFLTEYYLLNGKLSFVFEKEYKYNRHFYFDSLAVKDSDDKEIYDFKKSEVIETRGYFENEKLIHQINNQDCGSPFTEDYLKEEQNRITESYQGLRKLER